MKKAIYLEEWQIKTLLAILAREWEKASYNGAACRMQDIRDIQHSLLFE